MTTKTAAKPLFRMLQKQRILSQSDVTMLDLFIKEWECSPLQAVLDSRILTEAELANAVATIYQLDRIYSLRGHRIDSNSLKLIDYHAAKEHTALLLLDESGRYDLVLADPSDETYIAGLKKKSVTEFTLAVAERSDIVRAIDEKYPLGAQLPTIVGHD